MSKTKTSKSKKPARRHSSKKARLGNPVVAFRCPRPVVRAYVKKHGGREAALVALRRHMETASRGAAGVDGKA